MANFDMFDTGKVQALMKQSLFGIQTNLPRKVGDYV
jgi:hypothetical protein